MAVVTVVSLQRRLASLEAARGEHHGPSPFAEGIGLARAMGYPSTADMRDAMRTAGDPITGWSVRHGEAVERLLVQRGIDRAMGPVAVRDGLRAALDEVPEPIRAQRFRDRDVEAALAEAMEWLCL